MCWYHSSLLTRTSYFMIIIMSKGSFLSFELKAFYKALLHTTATNFRKIDK